MNATPPNRNEPSTGAKRAKKNRDDNTPVGVDSETVAQDVARYGALIANAEHVVDQNVNTPLTVSRLGFVNAMLRAFLRRSKD